MHGRDSALFKHLKKERDRYKTMLAETDPHIKRMEDAVKGIDTDDKIALRDAWRAEGIKMCIELIQEVQEIEGVAGVHVMAIEWEAAIEPIIKGAGLLPRPQLEAAVT